MAYGIRFLLPVTRNPNYMRIISGRFKRKIIKMPKGIRPTQDKVRKAVFDILRDMKKASFLDLYAGSGAVGLEALSWGAHRVIFVESDRRCIKKLKGNLASVGVGVEGDCLVERNQSSIEGSYEIIQSDVIRAIKQLSQ